MDENSPDSALVFAINVGYYAQELNLDDRSAVVDEAIRQGQQAGGLLDARYRPQIIGYLLRRGTIDRAAAEDIASETLKRFLGDPQRLRRSLERFFTGATFPQDWFQQEGATASVAVEKLLALAQVLSTICRPDGSIKSWVFQIARNKANDRSREKDREEPLPPDPAPVEDFTSQVDEPAPRRKASSPLRPPTQQEQKEAESRLPSLQRCFAELTEDENEVVQLMDLEGLTGAQVAKQLGQGLTTAYHIHDRAMQRLSECLCRPCCAQFDPQTRRAVEMHIAEGRSRQDTAEALGIDEAELVKLLRNVLETVRPCRGPLTGDEYELFRLHIIEGLSREETLDRFNDGRPKDDKATRLKLDRVLCSACCTRPKKPKKST